MGAAVYLSLGAVSLAALLAVSWRKRRNEPVYRIHRCPMCEGKGTYFHDDVHHPSAYDECPMCEGQKTMIVRVDQ